MEELTFSRFIREFNEADKEMNIIYHRLARHYRLSDSVFWVLYLLGEARGPMTQTKLCSALFLSKQTVNSALKKLESRGYLRMESMSGDRRNKLLSLTARGEELLRLAVEPTLSMEERRTFLDLSHRYLNAIREEAEPLLAQPAPEEWEEV
jgi:DNA-binding MarR family transcriptional regulator